MKKIYLLSKTFILVVGPTQPHTQWVADDISWGCNGRGMWSRKLTSIKWRWY